MIRTHSRKRTPLRFVLAELFALCIASTGLGQTLQPTAPVDGAMNTAWNETLSVDVNGSSGDVTFYGRISPPPGPDFSVIMLPDTQLYTIGENATSVSFFTEQVEWVVSNRVALNIAAVTHIGDVVQNYDTGNTNEWDHAAAAMYKLQDPILTGLSDGIPYGILPGNHDITGSSTVMYNQWFGTANFSGRSWYGGNQGINNDNFYIRFTASGVKMLIINIEWQADLTQVGPWARSVMQSHPDHLAIVSSHYVLRSGNPGTFAGEGAGIYNELKTEPNFFLMLGGHTSVEGRRLDTLNGNDVYTVLANYQSMPNGGNGWLRRWRFSPANNKIYATTYSPVLDAYMSGDSSEFELDLDFNRLRAWTQLGTDPAVADGSTATLDWDDLTPHTQHEWYATLGASTSSVSRFTTEANLPPVFWPASPSALNEERTFDHMVSATDPNQTPQAVNFLLDAGPAGASINVATGRITWPSTELDGPSTQTFVVTATDDMVPPAISTQTITLVVNEVNQPPLIDIQTLPTLPGHLLADAGTNLILQIAISDPDIPSNVLSLSIVSAPPGLTLTGNTLAWTPTTNDAGQVHRIQIRVSDDGIPSLDAEESGDVLVTQDGMLLLEPSIQRNPGTATVTWPALAGKTYRIETSPDLVAPVWTLFTEQTASSPTASINLPTVLPAQRIYVRISLLP